MFLTRFRLNTARSGARRLLSSPQQLHAAVMSSFAEPPGRPDGGPRVLWRVDHNSRTEVVLYLVGPQRPDLTHLVEQAGWPTTGGWQTYDYAPFLTRLTTDSTWSFRLTANPVHSIRRKDGEPTKRTAHLTKHHQARWLLDRQGAGGFTIVTKAPERQLLPQGDEYELIVRDQRGLDFTKVEQTRGSRSRVTLVTATYDGRLRVTDPDAMRHVLTMGLGKAKAYGCGLLTLAPVR
ncbi:type I-E CRISPR-associated protein Cas6/Cse3/CasE [Kitasatospora viridis]|uniref:CRISPR system Cascade subunit CasE n=1 Tax=Kitasatospora viridis TaxID=281105 RepID=A0A561T5Y4_9ACTN|nr:type I-E CRISPR-associated protein Cas6/Cse3/CasE [Kitasatospora viridis]TWF82524.1 CRISPR system Cascade subunit CasE [Kitasatospora viridis]